MKPWELCFCNKPIGKCECTSDPPPQELEERKRVYAEKQKLKAEYEKGHKK